MSSTGAEGSGDLLPPPTLTLNVVPVRANVPVDEVKVSRPKRVPMARLSLAHRGNRIHLLTNHFKVSVGNIDGYFSHYNVTLSYEDGNPVNEKGVGRKVIDELYKTYSSEFAGKNFAYDGEKSLFTVGDLPDNMNVHTVVVEDISSNRVPRNRSPEDSENLGEGDWKRRRLPYRSKIIKVEISLAAKIPIRAIANASHRQESESSQEEALRVLDIILRQKAAKQGCLLVRQSFFHNNPRNFFDIGEGVCGVHGFHSSFRATQGGLSLNMDVSTTMIIKPGSVIEFLKFNQNVRDPHAINWQKAKRTLKNLRVKASSTNMEYKITGLSDLPCNEQRFTLQQRRDGNMEEEEITVYNYFVRIKQTPLRDSADLQCINVGKPKKPIYIPLELCSLVSLQRYTKALSTLQRSSLVKQSRKKPLERKNTLSDELDISKYGDDQMLRACGISISSDFATIQGRVLNPPKLKSGRGEEFSPQRGRWNFNRKTLIQPAKVKNWAIVNFSVPCDVNKLWMDLVGCGQQKGIDIEKPGAIIQELSEARCTSPVARVDSMFEQMKKRKQPQFLLCLLPDRKTSPIYGPWKKKSLTDYGICTQCIAPQGTVNDQYLTNVLLKINAKLGGLNSKLALEDSHSIPLVSEIPTMILGMDVSHGSPGQSDMPSIAAVVSSRKWPSVSHYRASVRTQSPKVEMIDNLFKPVAAGDEGMIREILLDFYLSSEKRKPEHIIIFRDGVSESQFNQVLDTELNQIIEACKFDTSWFPKFTFIVAQKNHHTKFFQPGIADNVPAGTVIDNQICHPRNNDFYMCSHNGAIGTSRPTHYHVLHDDIDFSADDIQELVHSLSYVYQRSTTAISVVAPIRYAHLAAAQMGQFMNFDNASETSSGHDPVTSAGCTPVPQLPRLSKKVESSMFFC